MSVHAAAPASAPADPFAGGYRSAPPARPRLLSHAGRWGRARRWLPADALRVLDVGCAWGYGSAAIASPGPAGRVVVGVERDHELLEQAHIRLPWLTVIDADACELPLADDSADAVLLLEVIEHVADPRRVLQEAHRVLRANGTIIVTVPHAGATSGIDALNLYAAVRRRRPRLAPLEEGTLATELDHHHFAVAELRRLLEPGFALDRVARTGLGLQELATLGIIALRVGLRAPRAAALLRPLHFLAYLVDDLLPTGPLAYNLAVRARAQKPIERNPS